MRVLDKLFIFNLKSFAIADFLDQFWDRGANSTIFRVDVLDTNLYLCNKFVIKYLTEKEILATIPMFLMKSMRLNWSRPCLLS